MPESQDTFSREDYSRSLDTILKAAQEDYKQITYERRGRQHIVLRTYLWLSTVLIAAQATLFGHMMAPATPSPFMPWPVTLTPYFYGWSSLAALAALSCFALGIDTLRGRGIALYPYARQYKDFMDLAFKAADSEEPNKAVEREAVYIAMIRDLDNAISHHREEANTIGKKLRSMSYLILLSVVLTIFALAPTF